MAVAHSPVVYYHPPSKPTALRRYQTVQTFRKFAQGAGTAMLAYAGAGNVVGGGEVAQASTTPIFTDFTTLEGLTQGMIQGHLTGPAQILAGALLFLLAGKSSSRMFGLFAGLIVMYLYAQGVSFGEMWGMVEGFVGRFTAAADAFQTGGG